ncbi:uncharacterized protein LOC126095227 isoform X2 [Schistocerca cancellata]|nr:uncharacterized protein LOC126095227 isoform X2 [Schistocerca cancellata]
MPHSGDSSDEMNINGTFSSLPLLPWHALGKFNGNRMDSKVDGIWDLPLSGPHNIVYTDAEIFIEHFCVAGVGKFQLPAEVGPRAP